MELLVGAVIFVMLAGLMLTMTSEAGRIWQANEAQKKRREIARIVLERITRDLEAAAFPVGTQVSNSLAFQVNPPTLGSTYLSRDAAFWQARSQEDAMGMADIGYFVRWVDNNGQLCRVRIPASHGSSVFRAINRTINDTLLDELASGTADQDLRGLLAENVLGFWFVPVDRQGNAIPVPYDSRTTDVRPAFVDVGIAIADPRTLARISNPSEIRDKYGSVSIAQFEEALPIHIRRGTQVFTARIPVHATP